MGTSEDREFLNNPAEWPGSGVIRQCAVKRAKAEGIGPSNFGMVLYHMERQEYALLVRQAGWEFDTAKALAISVDQLLADGWIVD